MSPMVIALDWDGTVTMDLDGWLGFVRWMNNQGHSVYIVTMRYPSERDPDMAQFSPYIRAVVFTQRGAKKPTMDRLGVTVNVWVDDNPRAVLEDAQAIWGRATPEGQVVTTNEAAGEPVVHVPPAVDYDELVKAAWTRHRYHQGTNVCIAFKHGAEWQASRTCHRCSGNSKTHAEWCAFGKGEKVSGLTVREVANASPIGVAAHIQALEGALCDLMDGVKRHELEEETGLPTPDCDALWALYQSVKPQ